MKKYFTKLFLNCNSYPPDIHYFLRIFPTIYSWPVCYYLMIIYFSSLFAFQNHFAASRRVLVVFTLIDNHSTAWIYALGV